MKALVRRFLREEKTASVFSLAVIVSAVVWSFSSILGPSFGHKRAVSSPGLVDPGQNQEMAR